MEQRMTSLTLAGRLIWAFCPFGKFVFAGLLLVGLPASGSAQPLAWSPPYATVVGGGVFRTPAYITAFPWVPSPYAGALHGYADLTRATGQYWRDIGQARILREQSRQAALETARQRVEFEQWYESMRPTAPQMMAARREADLHWARYHAQDTQIWSGQTLNVLLRSILSAPEPTAGPHITLTPETVRGLNLTDGRTRDNLALAKDEGKIAWTPALKEEPFDNVREQFSKHFVKAIKSVREGEAPPRSLVRTLRAHLDKITSKLSESVHELPPSRFIEARRLLNNLNRTVEGFSNPRLVKAANDTWRKNIHTVADLVGHCKRNGLEFGPAVAVGDFPAYLAAFQAIRKYETGIWQMAARRSPQLSS